MNDDIDEYFLRGKTLAILIQNKFNLHHKTPTAKLEAWMQQFKILIATYLIMNYYFFANYGLQLYQSKSMKYFCLHPLGSSVPLCVNFVYIFAFSGNSKQFPF